MGLWNFVKETSFSWFGSKAEAATPPSAEVLKTEMNKIGLNTKGVELNVQGDKVVVTGDAVSPEMKEKIIVGGGRVALDDDARAMIIRLASGDARRALTALEATH